MIMIYFRLYRRDPHQMFELVCLLLQSIATSYFLCLKDLIEPSDANGTESPSSSSSSASSVCLGSDAKPSFDSVKLLNCNYIFDTLKSMRLRY